MNIDSEIFLYGLKGTMLKPLIVAHSKNVLKFSCNWVTYDSFSIYLGFYVAFNTVQVISRRVVGRAEEIST